MNFFNSFAQGSQLAERKQNNEFRRKLLQQQQDFKESQAPIQNQLESRRIGVSETKAQTGQQKQALENIDYLGKVSSNLRRMSPEVRAKIWPSVQQQLAPVFGEQITQMQAPDDAFLDAFAQELEQEKVKWSSPKAAINAQGQNVFMQDDGRGNFREVEGFRPQAKTPLVQVNTGERDNQFQKEIAKQDAKRFAGIEDAFVNSQKVSNQVSQLEEIMQGLQTGKMTPMLAEISALVGGDIASNAQAFQATANKMVLAAAESLKGALSDRDIELLQSTAPKLGNTPEANQLILDLIKKGVQQAQSQYQDAVNHVQNTGAFSGFRSSQIKSQPQNIQQMSNDELLKALEQ